MVDCCDVGTGLGENRIVAASGLDAEVGGLVVVYLDGDFLDVGTGLVEM